MKEIWKDVPGYEGLYQVSNLGRVKSNYIKKIINGSLRGGYLRVKLIKDGSKKTISIHQIVLMAFIGHEPNGMNIVVDHIDNNKLNNNLENLQLISNRENCSKDVNSNSGYTGVCFDKSQNNYISYIKINSKRIHLGRFKDKQKANSIYKLALKNLNKYNGNAKEFRELLKS